jgi:copper chaperone CopZ
MLDVASAGRGAVSVARTAAATAGATALAATRTVPDALRFGPRRFRRHAWASGGRGRIEVRGVGDESPNCAETASAVAAALQRVRGVRWAEVNAVTGHALVLFDERRVSMATLVETVTEVEDARDATSGGWSRAQPPHPDDPAALTAAVLGVVADAAGLVAALASRLLIVPPVPAAARAAIGAIEAQPRLRRLLESGLGPAGTDAVIGIGSGVANGLTGGVGPQIVTGLSHVLLVGEVRSRRRVWRERGCTLEEAPGGLPQHPPIKSPRPTPFPSGPIEVFADRVAAVSLLASGAVLTLTGDLSRTAKLLLIGVPPAARLGREAFASELARRLAGRGVLPMDPTAFRRLDRVDAVLVDERLLPLLPYGADWQSVVQEVAAQQHVLVGPATTADDQEFQSLPITADRIRRLQAEGRAVLVVAGGDNEVLAAADVAVAVTDGGDPAGWAADLIVAPDPATVLTLLRAIPAARRLSRRTVLAAAAGTALAGVATALVPWDPSDLTLQPVYLTGVLTQLDGIRTARRLVATTAGR